MHFTQGLAALIRLVGRAPRPAPDALVRLACVAQKVRIVPIGEFGNRPRSLPKPGRLQYLRTLSKIG